MSLGSRLASGLGEPNSKVGLSGLRWDLWASSRRGYEIIANSGAVSESKLKRAYAERKGNRAAAVIALSTTLEDGKLQVAGPLDPVTVRELDTDKVLDILARAGDGSAHQSAGLLERELRRLEESVVPGVRVKDLLTPYFVRMKFLNGGGSYGETTDGDWLDRASSEVLRRRGPRSWRSIFTSMGYEVTRLRQYGQLLRYEGSPVAVVHPKGSPEEFSKMNDSGELPEGKLLLECKRHNAGWGVMVSGLRFRLFQVDPEIGSAASRFIEIDMEETSESDGRVIGMLSPGALKASGGMFQEWITSAQRFGEDLRKGVEARLRDDALPNLARGIGKYVETRKAVDLTDRSELAKIEEAVLTLVFRFMFLLHVEARGYLPINNSRYEIHSATSLARDCRADATSYDANSTVRWDRLRTLVRMIRNGDREAGVPQYNGSLFADDGFPGAGLLEEVEVTDDFLAPALYAVAYDPENPGSGLDYASLQIGHLGAIYESLLARKLVRAKEPLTLEKKKDVYRPSRKGDKHDVKSGELFYQNEQGGRKSLGVFYTRHEFVRHLLNHSLRPALKDHFDKINALRRQDEATAAKRLFEFHVVDPAMGSGHFLTTALDMMADAFDNYLADTGGLPALREELDALRKQAGKLDAPVEDVDLLRRLILKRCIYGVDISPLAVEIANVTLWLASFVPGLALSYLGSNLKCGDALIGVADPQLIIGGEDAPMFEGPFKTAMAEAVEVRQELSAISDADAEEVSRSEDAHERYTKATDGLRRVFDMWTADPLGLTGARRGLSLYGNLVVDGVYGEHDEVERIATESVEYANRYRFLHWPLEFPHVFSGDIPGFDVVVGNPPWEEVTVEKLAFYAVRQPGLRGVVNLKEQQRLMGNMESDDPSLPAEFEFIANQLETKRAYFGKSGGYESQGVGDKDLYKLYCERYSSLAKDQGGLGVVLPRSMLVNKGSSEFREWLFESTTVQRIDTVRNTKRWAFPTHAQYEIALLTTIDCMPKPGDSFSFSGPTTGLEEFLASSSSVGVILKADSLPDRFMVPRLSSVRHADVMAKLLTGSKFDSVGIDFSGKIDSTSSAASRAVPIRELDETQQKRLFRHSAGLEVWKGRSFRAYDPHGEDPAGYAKDEEVTQWLLDRRRRSKDLKALFSAKELESPSTLPFMGARVAYRDVTNSVDYDTVIACLVPPKVPLTNKAPYVACRWQPLGVAFMLGVFNSVVFDWQARRHISLGLSHFILKMLRFPRADQTPWHRIGKLAARLSCVDDRFADFAEEAGVECGPQSDGERDDQRAEIDALVAHAYGLTKDETAFLFEDYPAGAYTDGFKELVIAKYDSV